MRSGRILLKPLTLDDFGHFYDLYKNPEVNHGKEPFLPGENATDFTTRIIGACVEIYTIRLTDQEDLIIGDCALHDADEEQSSIEIGGSLLPAFQGKGYMAETFGLLETRAKEIYHKHFLVTKTETPNIGAIRLMAKLGFRACSVDNHLITFKKELP